MGLSASLPLLQPPDTLDTQVLGHYSEKGSSNREVLVPDSEHKVIKHLPLKLDSVLGNRLLKQSIPAFKKLKFQWQEPGGKWSHISDKVRLDQRMD